MADKSNGSRPTGPFLANEVWNRYQHISQNGHMEYVRKAMKCESFFEGLQWDKEDLQKLKAAKRPALTINKIIATVANVMGEQIFNRSEIAFRPKKENASDEVATALTKVFMHISDNNHLPWIRSDVFADGIIGSRGFYDVRLDFSENIRGDIRITQLNPKNVLIDPDAEDYDPDKWSDVIITKWMSVDQIEELYGKDKADMIRTDNGASYFPFASDMLDTERDRFGLPLTTAYGPVGTGAQLQTRWVRVIERQYRELCVQKHFVDLRTGELRPVPEDWNRNQLAQYLQDNPNVTVTKKKTFRIRWCVVTGSIVLHDDWSPYKHFTVVPFFPFFRRGRTVGIVENLLGPQELLNKVSSQELHVVNTTANSGWKVKRNALRNMSISELEEKGAMTGLVLELEDIDSAEKIQPNQIPTGLDRISYKAEEHIKGISGVSDYMTGFAREDVAAKAVKANQQSGQSNLAKVMDNLVRTDHLLARNVLDIIQEYMTEPQILRITTDELTLASERVPINYPTSSGEILNDLTLGEFDVVVTTQPERDTFEDSQFEQALMLRTEAGLPIPDEVIIGASRLKDKAAIVEKLRAQTESPEAQRDAELAQQMKEAEVRKAHAEAAQAEVEVQHTSAKVQKELAAAKEKLSGANGSEVDYIKAQQEHDLELQKLELEHALAVKKLELELELKRREHALDMELRQKETESRIMTERAQAAMAMKQQSKPQPKGGKK